MKQLVRWYAFECVAFGIDQLSSSYPQPLLCLLYHKAVPVRGTTTPSGQAWNICSHVIGTQWTPATAAHDPGLELRPRVVDSVHAVEGPFCGYRFTLAHRRRPLRQYGTCFSTRRFIVPVEQGPEHADW